MIRLHGHGLYIIICIALLISINTIALHVITVIQISINAIALHIITVIQSDALISRRHAHRTITEPPSTAAYIKQTMMLTTMLLIL